MRFVDIKLSRLQNVADSGRNNYPSLRKLKVLFGQLFEYAVINEIITKECNIVEYLNIKEAGNPNNNDCSPFNTAEIELLWKNVNFNEYMQTILMLIYSGVRISEILDLKKSDVHLPEKWFYVRDSKTNAGIKAVPILISVYFWKQLTLYNCSLYVLCLFSTLNFLDVFWLSGKMTKMKKCLRHINSPCPLNL